MDGSPPSFKATRRLLSKLRDIMRLRVAALFLVIVLAACNGQMAILKRHRVYLLKCEDDGIANMLNRPAPIRDRAAWANQECSPNSSRLGR
jgi:hypothetical protein